MTSLFNQSAHKSQAEFNCAECSDTGKTFGKQTASNGKTYSYMRECVCVLETRRRKRLEIIPPKFQAFDLKSLRPRPDIHPKQGAILEKLKANPSANYFLSGTFGKGKTLFMWTLYREAVMNDKRVVFTTLRELLNEYHEFIRASKDGKELVYPRLSAGDLRQTHTRFSIFLDDVDKAKPTEYTAEQLFELSDAATNYGHQLVISTNLTDKNLTAHFERADERFGGAIVRRLLDNATICEMF